MSDVMTISKRNAAGLEEVLRTLLLDSDNKVPAKRLRIVGALDEGAIIEHGSNANGEYVKLADGTMWCWSTIALSDLSISNTDMIWNSGQYVPPASFSGAYDVMVVSANAKEISSGYSIFISSAYINDNIRLWSTQASNVDMTVGAAIRSGGNRTVNSLIIKVVAIGRWKA